MQLLNVLRLLSIVVCARAVAVPNGPSTGLATTNTVNNETTPMNGAELLRRTYLKYGVIQPSRIVSRATVNGTVTATPDQNDLVYLVPVAVGSPAATYTASLDTGNSVSLIYDTKIGKAGSVMTTRVTIGGVTVPNQKVTIGSSSSFDPGSNSIGMTPGNGSFYYNAVSQGIISPVFTANLKKGAPGTYTLGYIDKSAYTGTITYTPANTSQGFWGCSTSGYAIDTGTFTSSALSVIVDTDTTLILLPDSIVDSYYKQVSGAKYDSNQGGYTFSCSAKLPDFTIGFGSYRAVVPGSYMNFAPIDSTGRTCFGGLQSSSDIGINVLGLVFVKSQYVVFSTSGSPSLGFAKKA